MNQMTKQCSRRRDNWQARLVAVQLAVHGLGVLDGPPVTSDRWPGRLIAAGAVLIVVSGMALAAWLRRHL